MISDNKAKFRLYVEGYGTVTNCDWFVSGTVRSTKKRAAEDLKQLKAQLAEAKQVKEQIATITRQRDLAVEAASDAATSLETIQLRSFGEESYLDSKPQMRAFAGARAKIARDIISTIKESEGE